MYTKNLVKKLKASTCQIFKKVNWWKSFGEELRENINKMGKINLTIEIETPDYLEIFPEEGQDDSDFVTKAEKAELEIFRKNYSKDVHRVVKANIIPFIKNEFPEYLFAKCDDILNIEGFGSIEEYGIKIKVKEVKLDK